MLELLGSGKLQQLIRDAKQPALPSELRALLQKRQSTPQVWHFQPRLLQGEATVMDI